MKIIIKDNMGQTLLSFDQKTCFDQKSELPPCFLTKILLKEKSAEPDPIKSALLLKKMIKTLFKGHYKSNRIVSNSNFLKIFETEKNWKVC